jgi:hypothetical protein
MDTLSEKYDKTITYIEGSRRLSNILWALTVSLGGFGFFLAGLSSYIKVNLLLFSKVNEILFIPQGIVLLFYGTAGTLLGIFLCLTVWWDIGFGYNEYNKKLQQIYIYRKGFPNQNRDVSLTFLFSEIKSIKVRVKEGLNPKRQLILCLKDSREIPLTGTDNPVPLSQIEREAVDLAKYLNVYIETE